MATKSEQQTLSLQYAKIFDKMSQAFDARKYEDAVRFADQILEEYPGHGETTAMKGLTLHTQDKKEEGFALAKEGVAKNPRSSVAWHCLGLIYKAEKDHVEAVKAFKRSTVIDQKNLNAARDLSSSAIQIRDWPQLVEVRQQMLNHRAYMKGNWYALSCAHRMNGNPELALAILDLMIQFVEPGDNEHEKSEIHLYRAETELLLKRPTKALDVLRINDAVIADVSVKTLLRAHAYSALSQHDKAEPLYLELIGKGFHEAECIVALAKARGIPMEERLHLPLHHCNRSDPAVVAHCDAYVALLDQIAAAAPRCDAAKRFALDVCSDEAFEGRLRSYIRPYIIKMIPSVTFILKSLYNFFPATDGRIAAIGAVLHSWEAALEKDDYDAFYASFDGTAAASPTTSAAIGDRNPALLLWVYQFLASHYLRIKDYGTAHKYADKAIDHTPTIEMLYLLKAKICAREGDLAKAAELADTARRLDLQDKYLAAKSAKYYFRVGDVEKAEANLQLFMKADTDPAATYLNALDSQTVWYERECGDAFMIKNDPISALQNYAMFEKHHKDNHDEMVDFHNYTFRRATIRQWIDYQEKNYEIGLQRFFILTCPRMIKAYLAIHADGEEAVRARHVPRPAPLSTSTEADKDKEESEKDKEKEAEEKQKQKQYKDHYLKDIDISSPLAKARRYVDALLHYRPAEAETHSIAIKYFMALETLPAPLVVYSLQQLKKIAKGDGTGVAATTVPNGERAKAAEAFAACHKAFTEKWAAVKGTTDPRVVTIVENQLAKTH